MSQVAEAIQRADALLPGVAAPEGDLDPRWQAIIAVADYIESDPDPVWAFAAKWGVHGDSDLQAAIATCVVEHLLEYHFDRVFPLAASLARSDPNFAEVLRMCWRFGQSAEPGNAARLKSVLAELDTHAG